jgi:predicted nucleic acid-binding protein
MSFLVDTNVLSELVRKRPNPGVVQWAQGIKRIVISAVTVEEVYFGLSWKPNPQVRLWFDEFLSARCEILPVTSEIAKRSGEIRGQLQARGQTRSSADLLIASTAQEHHLTLVTRNVRDFLDCGVPLLNPFHGE